MYVRMSCRPFHMEGTQCIQLTYVWLVSLRNSAVSGTQCWPLLLTFRSSDKWEFMPLAHMWPLFLPPWSLHPRVYSSNSRVVDGKGWVMWIVQIILSTWFFSVSSMVHTSHGNQWVKWKCLLCAYSHLCNFMPVLQTSLSLIFNAFLFSDLWEDRLLATVRESVCIPTLGPFLLHLR